jgi:hypothetical protein
MNNTLKIAFFIFLCFHSSLTFGGLRKNINEEKLNKIAKTLDIDNNAKIDTNNVEMYVTNHGSFAYNITSGNSGLIFPKGTTKTAVFASGIWIGAKVNGEVRTCVGEFSQEFAPGNMVNGTFVPDNPRFKVYKINKEDGPENQDWKNWPSDLGAPVDKNGNPLVLGDQTLWAVYNDADPSYHSNSAGNSDPFGIEIQQTTFAFSRQGPLNNIIFLKFIIINKGNNILRDTFISLWSDPDLGGAGDDLVGCDVDLSLGYCYNATNNDEIYGNSPPSVGYDFFKGPKGDNGEILPMTSFNKYINGTDPRTKYETYNYMRGLNSDGSLVIDPVENRITRYVVSGDPITNEGWVDADPADRRFMLSTGPFTFAPNDTQEIVAGIILGQGKDRLTSIRALKFYDTFAQDAFDREFKLPSPPESPKVSVTQLDRKIILTWGSESEEYLEPNYKFEGYNIYHGESIAGPWKRIATFDTKNNVRIIFDDEFDIESGIVLNKPVQFGNDTGIKQYLEIVRDEIWGGKLINGKQYYFSITAYGYNPNGIPKTLESAIKTIMAIPQKPIPETDLSPVLNKEIKPTYSRIDNNKAPSTDSVKVIIIDPIKLTGNDYKVEFKELTTPVIKDNDSINVVWNLVDLTNNKKVLENQTNKSGDEHYNIIDGIQVKVMGGKKQGLSEVLYVDLPNSFAPGLEPVEWGDGFFNGCADFGSKFFGSALNPNIDPDKFLTAEIRFSLTNVQKAYRYLRGDNPTYKYQDFVDVPFTVWDPISNKQLNCAFTENKGSPTENKKWTPATTEDGGWEVIFIFSSTYRDTPDPVYVSNNILFDANKLDIMYVIWLKRKKNAVAIDTGDIIRFNWNNPSDSNDFFTFSTPKAIFGDKEIAKSKLNDIRVVPNPYFGHSSYEMTQFNRVIKFTNLPEKCTIRIFSLAGALIKTLHKDDPSTSIITWNLLTENNLTPASGIYIYHIGAEGIGEIIGKMAIFIEKERLNVF